MKRELSILPPGQAPQSTQRTHTPLSSLNTVSIINIFFGYIINVAMHNRQVSLEQNVLVTPTGERKKFKLILLLCLHSNMHQSERKRL